jgi:hypothetical protein
MKSHINLYINYNIKLTIKIVMIKIRSPITYPYPPARGRSFFPRTVGGVAGKIAARITNLVIPTRSLYG